MGSDEHVHGGEMAAFLPGGGAEVGIGFCGGGVPRENADAQEELVDEFGEFCGLGFQSETEKACRRPFLS